MQNEMKKEILLTLIRCGRTISNEEKRYLGKQDEVLSEEGRKEIEEGTKLCRYPRVQQVFASGMIRAKDTAEIIYPEIKAEIISEWNEIDFGLFEGKTYEELMDVQAYQEWIDSKGMLTFPEGENREAFINRCNLGMKKMISNLSENTKAVAAIAHSGTIMALLSAYCGGDYYDYMVSNGSGFQVRVLIGEEIKIEGMKRI